MMRSTFDPGRDLWQARAYALLQNLEAVLAWARDAKWLAPSQANLPRAVTLRGIASIAEERRLPVLHTDGEGLLDLSDMPDALALPLCRSLGETGGYDLALPYSQQRSEEPQRQRSYVLFAARHQMREWLA